MSLARSSTAFSSRSLTARTTGAPLARSRKLSISSSRGKLWELTDLSASEFADEAARFFGLDRVTLQDMLSAASLCASFAQRFLREMMVFPIETEEAGC